ncbi:I78 family peptidase inhibitor [Pseudomonas sp. CCC3.1]|uniref:I78 family peptidase inhibitor n=1 Tax=Pseudomonas sp. CCC3.1 TaxID=3048607 RepID=UPI002AC8D84F|nr:I78 family peptidase inhibitor [Pseudomonas sp. CCC3.1]MEB0205052.1 I78 family peptidase inhibitor [Pseudomonas sp. CCC3.1]WPX36241.1 I78 family peptidase inhibitor [Pseudomonas sp. CCC3.1]
MSGFNVLKGVLLATGVVLGTASLPAMASEDGKCNTNLALNYVVAPVVTPELVELLRTSYGAKEARVERPGEAFTKEFNAYRLRVLADKDNTLVRQICG